MYTNYDQAVKSLMKYKMDNGMSYSVISAFKHHAKEFKDFLVLREIPFELCIAKKWVSKRREETAYGTFKQLRHTIVEIVKFIMPEVEVVIEFYEFTTPYQRLQNWSRSLLCDFLHAYPDIYNETRKSISLMLVHLQGEGIKSVHEITCKHIAEYRSLPSPYQGKGIRAFLRFLHSKGLIGPFAAESYNSFFYNRILKIQNYKQPEYEKTFSIDDYIGTGRKLYDALKENNYSESMKNVSRAAFIEFGIFLECNHLMFSKSLVDEWLSMKLLEKKTTSQSYRKCLYQISDILEFENKFNIAKVYSKTKLPPVPYWAKPHVDQFIAERKQDGLAKSTLVMDFNSVRRFLLYAESSGCKNLEDITVRIIKDFHETDIHKTNEGKAAYNTRIRGFLSFLAESQIISSNLPTALSSCCRVKTRPVKTLSTEQRQSVVQKILNPTSGFSPKRDSAILAIGLLSGLRASDIAKLKFKEIDWGKKEFSIIQQKTRKHHRSPFPEVVGNRLYSYIIDERPDSASEYVFIGYKAPFRPIGRNCCTGALKRTLKEKFTGFHILRKTFASNLLCSGSSISLIADALGHESNEAIDPYLDTNTLMMTKCFLGLGGIEYTGGTL